MTYFAHARYRDPHSEFSAEFREYLRTTPVVFRPSQNPRKSVNSISDGTTGEPQAKRVRQSLDDSSEGDNVQVRNRFMGIYDGANRSTVG
jgi:hypothetical protein